MLGSRIRTPATKTLLVPPVAVVYVNAKRSPLPAYTNPANLALWERNGYTIEQSFWRNTRHNNGKTTVLIVSQDIDTAM